MMVSAHAEYASRWEEKATIRSRPRLIVEDDGRAHYPAERQPLVAHPAILALPKDRADFILLQSLYKYLNDVIIFETEIVARTARAIARGTFPFSFPREIRLNALSVVIDEDYHAYVAMDFMRQVEALTGIAPIELPDSIELSTALPAAMELLPAPYRHGLELLGVAIAENTITAEVAAFARDREIKRSVKSLMADHLSDEAQHSRFWIAAVRMFWESADEEMRVAIGRSLPAFLELYLANGIQAAFDRRLVAALELGPERSAELEADLITSYPITARHPMIANIRTMLASSGVLDHDPTRNALARLIEEDRHEATEPRPR